MAHAATQDHHDDHHSAPKGFFRRWVMSTNHKDIGTLYLVFALTMFFIGGSFAMVIRAELFKPGLQLVQPYFFNQMTTMHALVMIFGAIMPAFVGLGNWMIPLMIGAPDMALPRMNNLSFWILPFAFLLMLSTLFLPGGGPSGGWTMYPPLSLQSSSLAYVVFAIHLMGISSIMGAINIIATILNMRAPGMDLLKMPVFVWSWLITAFLLIAVMPVLAGAVTMLLTDKYFGTNFFNAAGGGDPVLYQHIFWFFGHPEVYIMILPAFGIISEIVPTFARKPIFGYKAMVLAIAAIAFLSFIVWAHHMFAVGLPMGAEIFFMYATMLIAVPTGIKVFNWVATMWGGSMTFETPMLFAIAFIILFTLGGFSGLMMALVPADFQYHDTYFIVAHFHYVLVTGALFAIIAAAYYWLPKWTGHMYSETWGKIHFWNSGGVGERAVLPAAFPRPGRHAATHSRLQRGVRQLQHDQLDRRLPVRRLAVDLHRRADLIACSSRRRRPPIASGKAPRDWNGRCLRRRRTTPSPLRRSFVTKSWRTAMWRTE
ncbi:cytochrome c oxidase subunit I [Rhodanobacter sp. 115]|nr:cytochrome c oxidase subunit I [Rhodanobacter sp. 115]